MKSLFFDARCIILILCTPLLLCGWLAFSQYDLISALLDPAAKQGWTTLFTILPTVLVLHAGYAIYLFRLRRPIPVAYAWFSLAQSILLMWLFYDHYRLLLPFGLPRWTEIQGFEQYMICGLMPNALHALALLIFHFSPDDRPARPGRNFLYALAVPVIIYIAWQCLLPLWQRQGWHNGQWLPVLLIAPLVVFMFFLFRGVFLLSRNRAGQIYEYQRLYLLVITLVLPPLGLVMNEAVGQVLGVGDGFFGDFNAVLTWLLLGITAVAVYLPAPRSPCLHLLQFLLRTFTLPFTLYFFAVFLPFVPLGALLVLLFGLGLLMLCPTALLAAHLQLLFSDLKTLCRSFKPRVLYLASVGSFLLIPLAITASFLHDRAIVAAGLRQLEQANGGWPDSRAASLLDCLDKIERHKNARDTGTPFLDAWFNYLVLHNQTLSDASLNRLRQIYGAAPVQKTTPVAARPGPVSVTGVRVTSRFNLQAGTWTSWIHFTMLNSGAANETFDTQLRLPAGCWVSDHYLDINGRKEQAILAERKAANWIYSEIRNENRDPSLLNMENGNRIRLRIFPFAPAQVRQAGFRLEHRAPVTLQIGDKKLEVGKPGQAGTGHVIKGAVYLTAKQKAALPKVFRKPLYHILIDMSKQAAGSEKVYLQRLSKFMNEKRLERADVRIGLVNQRYVQTDEKESCAESLQKAGFSGGFYLENAIRQILLENYRSGRSRYPVMVVISRNFSQAILPDSFSEFSFCYPEEPFFYELGANGQLLEHALDHEPQRALGAGQPRPTAVYAWPDERQPERWLRAEAGPAVFSRSSFNGIDQSLFGFSIWEKGLLCAAQEQFKHLYPEHPSVKGRHLLKAGFRSGLLTSESAFIALENEAQKKALLKKQQDMLNGDPLLDAGEEMRMDEPSLGMLLICGGLLLMGGFFRQFWCSISWGGKVI